MPLSPQARDLVIRTILGEAGNEPPEGQLAVANVIANRANSGAWGDPEQGGLTNTIRAPKQFSMWNDDPKMQAYAASILAVPTTDPRYQRAAAIVDAMANGQAEDNTAGATHYYAPSGMPGGVAPSWAEGQQGRRIGSQLFYRLPLTASNTAGAVDLHAQPSTVQTAASAPLDALGPAKPQGQQAVAVALADAKSMLGKNEVPNHDELMSYLKDGGQDLDPHKAAWCAAFVSASLQKAGLPVPTEVQQGSAYGPGAWAPNYQTYGSAVDPKNIQAGDILVRNDGHHVGFAEGSMRQGVNGPEVQMLAGNEADPSGQYAPGAGRAQVGLVAERWVPLSEYSARRYAPQGDTAVASAAAPTQPFTPYKVAGAMQPPPASSTPPTAASPPAASPAAPGADKATVMQGMTSGGGAVAGKNPFLYTAANWGGASAPTAPAPPAGPDLAQRVPLDQTPTPPPRPLGFGVNQSALAANPPTPPPRPTDALSSDLSAPNNSAGGRNPNMADPRFGNSFASAPGPVFASAYPPPALASLLNSLFGTG